MRVKNPFCIDCSHVVDSLTLLQARYNYHSLQMRNLFYYLSTWETFIPCFSLNFFVGYMVAGEL